MLQRLQFIVVLRDYSSCQSVEMKRYATLDPLLYQEDAMRCVSARSRKAGNVLSNLPNEKVKPLLV